MNLGVDLMEILFTENSASEARSSVLPDKMRKLKYKSNRYTTLIGCIVRVLFRYSANWKVFFVVLNDVLNEQHQNDLINF